MLEMKIGRVMQIVQRLVLRFCYSFFRDPVNIGIMIKLVFIRGKVNAR
jgi:hypothetical protein